MLDLFRGGAIFSCNGSRRRPTSLGVTAARSTHPPASPLHRLFADGTFEIGEHQRFHVVREDFPTEYAAGEYLAIATLGQPIAVGTVHLHVPSRYTLPHRRGPVNGWKVYELDLAIVPGRGVWQLEPVFAEWVEPVRRAAQARRALEKLLGEEPGALPLSMAYIPVLGREIAASRPDSVPLDSVYSPTLFAEPLTGLRTTVDPRAADALVTRILEVGTWIDGKSDDRVDFLDAIPAWLADLLPGYDEIE